MARITVEDCLEKIQNRFILVHAASKRVKQIMSGSKLSIENKDNNKNMVMSLREIAEGKVRIIKKKQTS